MTTFLVPAVYTIKARLHRARNPSLLRIIEQVPVMVRNVDLVDAPVAISATIENREPVKYRLVDGELYGPAFWTPWQQAENAAHINCRSPFLPDDFKALLPAPEFGDLNRRRGAPPRLLDPVLNKTTALALDDSLPLIREMIESDRDEGIAFAQRAADKMALIDGVIYKPSLGPVYSFKPSAGHGTPVLVSEIEDAPFPQFILRLDEHDRLKDFAEPLGRAVRTMANPPFIHIPGHQTFDSDDLALVMTAAQVMANVPDRYLHNMTFRYMELYFTYHSPGFDRENASQELADLMRDFAAEKANSYISGSTKDDTIRLFLQAEQITDRLNRWPAPLPSP